MYYSIFLKMTCLSLKHFTSHHYLFYIHLYFSSPSHCNKLEISPSLAFLSNLPPKQLILHLLIVLSYHIFFYYFISLVINWCLFIHLSPFFYSFFSFFSICLFLTFYIFQIIPFLHLFSVPYFLSLYTFFYFLIHDLLFFFLFLFSISFFYIFHFLYTELQEDLSKPNATVMTTLV